MKPETNRADSALSPDIVTTSARNGTAERHFRQQLSSTPRGARLARLLAERQLAGWGWPRDSAPGHTAALVVAELAANAAAHGRLPGRDFLLALTYPAPGTPPGTLLVEVSDARGERLPVPAGSAGAAAGSTATAC